MAKKSSFSARRLKTKLEKSLQKEILDAFQKEDFKPLMDEVIKQISKGISPVEGVVRFAKYSASYRASIKSNAEKTKAKQSQVSPVNLKLTGDLHKSIRSKESKAGVIIEFTDFKAEFHNNSGAGKSKVIRRILPSESGETFTNLIRQRFRRIAASAVKKAKLKK